MAFSGCSASIAVKISIFDWTISLSPIPDQFEIHDTSKSWLGKRADA
jgi:hypothetical protein